MYSKETLQNFQNPEFAGVLKDASATGEEGNVRCGDLMKIYIKVENDKIIDIRFQTYGCVAAIASSNALCMIVKGKTLDEASKLTHQDIINELGKLPPVKVHCSVLGIEALTDAINNYKNNISPVID